ncbi:stage II sporulation protein D [Caldalkalibacillus mannanilyticus]|uniref:stage II sporulation protein D n=1 Tax=Caldalkalibacillus mannanilyticus TaxID=1418 RepID=UPI000467F07D|nr:stage II sporulation protein D [Caldalkalibacillus mannanilyticus]
MVRPVFIVTVVLFVLIVAIPTFVVQFLPKAPEASQETMVELVTETKEVEEAFPQVEIAVYRTGSKTIEKVPLELYIRGVVASEMPANFELEALKAQALAARTYIVRRLVEKDYSDTPKGSIVTDTERHQVYQSEGELKKRWGKDFEPNLSKVNQAVNETMGQVLTYEGRPINATFFSTSNGYTENSEEYWGTELPYLRSVTSPWDQDSPRYKEQVVMSIEEFQKKLGIKLTLPTSPDEPFSEVVSRTEGNRIGKIKVGEASFTGKEVREMLNLSSSHFEWHIKNGNVYIDTIGWGHGVGMSQWGANGMAKEGHTAEEIVTHYYKGIMIQDYRHWIVKR